MESKKNNLTQARLKELIDYNPQTGMFSRKVALPGGRVGPMCVSTTLGYFRFSVDGRRYLAHRLAWLYVYGRFPENEIDHINRKKDDNRIDNLRDVSRVCNTRNTANRATNKSGVKGVCWDTCAQKWRAGICVEGRSITLGVFYDFDEAVCVRLAAEQCLSWRGCGSNSPAYQYVYENILKKNKQTGGYDGGRHGSI